MVPICLLCLKCQHLQRGRRLPPELEAEYLNMLASIERGGEIFVSSAFSDVPVLFKPLTTKMN